MRCALCGFEFALQQAIPGCQRCPARVGCGLVRCPRCGYDSVPEPRLLRLLRRWRRRLRSGNHARSGRPSHAATLADMVPGQVGCVQSLVHPRDDGRRALRLAAMGVMPGSWIRLLRRSPSYLLEVGHSRFAIDRDMAKGVLIRVVESEEDGDA